MKKEISDILKNQVFVMAAQFDRADDKDKPQYAQATCTLVAELVRNNVKHSTDIEKCLEKQLQLLSKAYDGDVQADMAGELADAMVSLAETLEYY